MNLFAFLKSRIGDKNSNSNISNTGLDQSKDCYTRQYEYMLIQRNWLVLLVFILLLTTAIGTVAVIYMNHFRKFEPFVVQIDNTTGNLSIVNPLESSLLSGNDALSQYFIKKYIIARETYNPVDFTTLARHTIRLFSTTDVYRQYWGYIQNEDNDLALKYNTQNTTYLTIKSWSKIKDDRYIVRFSIHETTGSMMVFNKIVVVEFTYTAVELTEQDKDINPVGFVVTSYRVDDDYS
ncbi:VirB8 family type IV secretion system protein [Rickettsia endosymbiont of Cardiosporidium cionae]|uniref:virB8 family protein n=1 Tax=Rickettsia endosymbiont of Cardiosporidium cionae TaxID=2777155 RepID=UPI001892DFA2|nr:VirB8/TrbF family protein [Rickettsia endosymbiont of Cardiosporidium cionae]KAF8818568.1 virB8 family protein [Rickettsia endosymbiont of Cardiosporidium cionae]